MQPTKEGGWSARQDIWRSTGVRWVVREQEEEIGGGESRLNGCFVDMDVISFSWSAAG